MGMSAWTVVFKKGLVLPLDRPFIAFWRNQICLIQYSKDTDTFFCSAYPAMHLHFLELRQRELNDITHWMDLPRSPYNPHKTGDTRKSNYGKYELFIKGSDHEKETKRNGSQTS